MKESERTYNLTGFGMSVAGWGLTIDSEGSDIKYKHYVKEVSNEECQSTYTSASVDIIPSQICVTGGIYQNSCTSQRYNKIIDHIMKQNNKILFFLKQW